MLKFTATRAQAEDVVEIFKLLGDQDKLFRFLLQSDDLPRVLPLLGALSVGDKLGVAARLEALELAQKQGIVDMKRMVDSVARAAVQPTVTQIEAPQIVVSSPNYAKVVGGAGTRGPARGPGPLLPQQFFSRPARTEGGGGLEGPWPE